MRYLLTSSVTLFFAAPVLADDTALGQAATNYTQKSILQIWAVGKGPMTDGAKQALPQVEHQERIDSRSPRRSMQGCIKPGSVFDYDVKGCMSGLNYLKRARSHM